MIQLIKATALLNGFLKAQRHGYRQLKKQFPDTEIDLYQDRLEDLFENLKVLMYYQLTPHQLTSLLELAKQLEGPGLLNEPRLDADTYGKIAANLHTLLYKQGQINTFREQRPVDCNDDPIPWITYPALEYLNQFDFSEKNVFEFGAGNSTLFWAGKANRVVSVETDPQWFDWLNQDLPPNVQLSCADDAEGMIDSIRSCDIVFDVIVIDSLMHRYAVTQSVENKLAPGGMIIFDNADWYPNSCEILRDAGYSQVDFHGFGPVNGYAWTTSIFFKDHINFNRIEKALHPIGGISVVLEDDRPQDRIG